MAMNKSTKAWLLAGVMASVLSAGVNAKTFATSAAGVSSLVAGDVALAQKVELVSSPIAEANAFASAGNDFVVHSKVPEPETYALIGVGLLGLMLAHRRKYKENSANSQISF